MQDGFFVPAKWNEGRRNGIARTAHEMLNRARTADAGVSRTAHEMRHSVDRSAAGAEKALADGYALDGQQYYLTQRKQPIPSTFSTAALAYIPESRACRLSRVSHGGVKNPLGTYRCRIIQSVRPQQPRM